MSDESNNADTVRALIEKWRGKAYPITGTAALRLAECADELEAALASAPPSAPVGVEWNDEAAWSLAARAEAAGAERDSDDNGTWWTLRIDHFNALAQQPAAPSGEAVVEKPCLDCGVPVFAWADSEPVTCLGCHADRYDAAPQPFGDMALAIQMAIAASPKAGSEAVDADEEHCESRSPECGPVEHWDSEAVPLCAKCWSELQSADHGAEAA